MQTSLKDLNALSIQEWVDQIGHQRAHHLYKAYNTGALVTVLREATDGYYDIEACGVEIPAIAGVHLQNIDKFVDPSKKPGTLGVQFTLELKVEGYVPDSPLNHEQMQRALSLFVERTLVNFGYEGHRTTLGSLLYEADYPLDA